MLGEKTWRLASQWSNVCMAPVHAPGSKGCKSLGAEGQLVDAVLSAHVCLLQLALSQRWCCSVWGCCHRTFAFFTATIHGHTVKALVDCLWWQSMQHCTWMFTCSFLMWFIIDVAFCNAKIDICTRGCTLWHCVVRSRREHENEPATAQLWHGLLQELFISLPQL